MAIFSTFPPFVYVLVGVVTGQPRVLPAFSVSDLRNAVVFVCAFALNPLVFSFARGVDQSSMQ